VCVLCFCEQSLNSEGYRCPSFDALVDEIFRRSDGGLSASEPLSGALYTAGEDTAAAQAAETALTPRSAALRAYFNLPGCTFFDDKMASAGQELKVLYQVCGTYCVAEV
jgi:hypothetical protein